MIGYFNDKAKKDLLGVGAVYKSTDGNIYKRELTEDELLGIGKGEVAKKKAECKKLILDKYSESDQQNIQTEAIETGDKTELIDMNTFIKAMINEYRTKGKDADFTSIV